MSGLIKKTLQGCLFPKASGKSHDGKKLVLTLPPRPLSAFDHKSGQILIDELFAYFFLLFIINLTDGNQLSVRIISLYLLEIISILGVD